MSGTGSVAVTTVFEGGFFANLEELADDVKVFFGLGTAPKFHYNPATPSEASSFTLPLSFGSGLSVDQTLDINLESEGAGVHGVGRVHQIVSCRFSPHHG